MSDYISNLPEFPEEYDDYLLVQGSNGKYLLLCFYNGTSFTVKDNGTLQNAGGYHYTLSADGTTWDYATTCGGSHPFTSNNYKPVFSTVDCFDTSGNLLYSGNYYSAPPTFIGGMSTSDISSSLLSNIWLVIPLVMVLAVGLVGVRKAVIFFRSLIRGA